MRLEPLRLKLLQQQYSRLNSKKKKNLGSIMDPSKKIWVLRIFLERNEIRTYLTDVKEPSRVVSSGQCAIWK